MNCVIGIVEITQSAFIVSFSKTTSTPLKYSKIKPEMKIENSNIILATSAQVYPNITSWNASTGLAQKAVNLLYKNDNQI